jgi:hypothetical protein
MTGTKLINKVIFKFTKLVDDLDEGVRLIEEEQSTNTDIIQSLTHRNFDLEVPKNSAKNVATNLRKLLGTPGG